MISRIKHRPVLTKGTARGVWRLIAPVAGGDCTVAPATVPLPMDAMCRVDGKGMLAKMVGVSEQKIKPHETTWSPPIQCEVMVVPGQEGEGGTGEGSN